MHQVGFQSKPVRGYDVKQEDQHADFISVKTLNTSDQSADRCGDSFDHWECIIKHHYFTHTPGTKRWGTHWLFAEGKPETGINNL